MTEYSSYLRKKSFRALLKNRLAVVGGVISLILILVAITAPFIVPQNPVSHNPANRLQAPGEKEFFFGTDRFGRDILSRVIWGSRISLQVSIFSVVLAFLIGVPVGMLAGYKGGWVDLLVMRAIDIALSFPTLILGLIVLSLLGPGIEKVILAISFVLAPRFARMTRGPTLSLVQQEFIQAAKALGASDFRIIKTHILPNVIGELVIVATLWIATAIRIEVNLSFIGLGVQPPTPTWGNMVREGIGFLSRAPWIVIFPSLAIFLAIFAFNLIGDGFRDYIDPRTQNQ